MLKHWLRVLVLNCITRVRDGGFPAFLGIPIRDWKYPFWARYKSLILVPVQLSGDFRRESTIVKEPAPITMDRRPASFSLARISQAGDTSFDDADIILDEVYCLPHAKYSPTERRLSFLVDHQGLHGAIFFKPKPRLDTGPSPRSKYSQLFPFAIVLRQLHYPEFVFVPLLAPERMDKDFHLIFRRDKRLVSHCITKEQLRRSLTGNRNWDFFWRPCASTCGLVLDCQMKRAPVNDSLLETVMERWESRIHVAIHVGSLDLMRNTCYVFLESRSCNTGDSRQPSRQFDMSMWEMSSDNALRQFNHNVKYYLENWWKIKELGWFEEQA